MMKFEAPEIKITVLEVKDTIATSTGNGASGDVGGVGDDD